MTTHAVLGGGPQLKILKALGLGTLQLEGELLHGEGGLCSDKAELDCGWRGFNLGFFELDLELERLVHLIAEK